MKSLFHLPTALLVLLLEAVSSRQYDGDEIRVLRARDEHALLLLGDQQPQAVRKMSADAGEKFWPHYWEFDNVSTYLNATSAIADSPLAMHELSSSLFGRALYSRDAACPTTPYNTSSCAAIGYADSCCPVTSYCYTVTDTGNGPVGCCPNGATCGNTVGTCQSGYTSCPNSSNKGCCIPGYTCADSICVNAGTSTAVATPSTSTTTIGTSTTTAAISVTTVTLVNISPSGYTTTATVTVTQSASSTTDSAVAPVRPTTDSSSSTASIAPAAVSTTTTTTSTSTSTSNGAGYCPTGYYVCSAVYSGGCCQVGRDCNTSNCPATASTTVVDGSPTVVAPAGASSNAQTCASGWFSCAASLGGNCCPTGYNCAQTNCLAIATGAAAHDKEAPNEASAHAFPWVLAVTAISAALGTIIF